jgi:hypothetical protein
MKCGLTREFIETILEDITPFQYLSATENVAMNLYSLIRMLRPKSVVEFGTGYTTPFILQALRDNQEEHRMHQRILQKKASQFHKQLSDPNRNKYDDIEDWWADSVTQEVYGREPILPIPSFYFEDYQPQLFSFEVLPKSDRYVQKLIGLIDKLKLNNLFTLNAGSRVKDYTRYIPEAYRIIDLAWNDFGNKYRFYEETYEHLNPNGGLMLFHNTTNSEKDFKADLEKVEEAIKQKIQSKDCELLTLVEPHKFTQRSITLLKRIDGFKEEYFEDRMDEFDRDMVSMLRRKTRGEFA